MKRLKPISVVLIFLLVGCHSLNQELRAINREFYSGNNNMVSRTWNGFSLDAPESWFSFIEMQFDEARSETGTRIAIRSYKWSPLVQFNRLDTDVNWAEDLVRMDAELCKREELRDVDVSESLYSYNKFTGHGLRKVGLSRGRRAEHIIFYPEGELRGTRLLVVLYGSPNEISLNEMERIIQSVAYKSANE